MLFERDPLNPNVPVPSNQLVTEPTPIFDSVAETLRFTPLESTPAMNENILAIDKRNANLKSFIPRTIIDLDDSAEIMQRHNLYKDYDEIFDLRNKTSKKKEHKYSGEQPDAARIITFPASREVS